MKRNDLLAIMAMMAFTPAVVAQDFSSDRVYLEADVLIDNQDEGIMIAEGNVVARYADRQLTADRVIYNLQEQKVHAIGNVRIVDPDGTVRVAEELEVDGSLSDGVAANFAAQLPQNAVVVARTAARDDSGSNSLEYAIYTACPICEEEGSQPTWSLRAR
ncbi:MAG TPA: LPS-assembly protein LptD, partial [Hyphomonadaceae bacterium]|nr:LPS-assembly protein LptD [Hyphomonadaceae bacterium]